MYSHPWRQSCGFRSALTHRPRRILPLLYSRNRRATGLPHSTHTREGATLAAAAGACRCCCCCSATLTLPFIDTVSAELPPAILDNNKTATAVPAAARLCGGIRGRRWHLRGVIWFRSVVTPSQALDAPRSLHAGTMESYQEAIRAIEKERLNFLSKIDLVQPSFEEQHQLEVRT